MDAILEPPPKTVALQSSYTLFSSPTNAADDITNHKLSGNLLDTYFQDAASGGIVNVSCKLLSKDLAMFTITDSRLDAMLSNIQDLTRFSLSTHHNPAFLDEFQPERRGLSNELIDSIIFSNVYSKRPTVLEVRNSTDQLRLKLFLPKKEVRYCTDYILEEPGMLVELALPTKAGLCEALNSYFYALSLGFFYLCCPRIIVYLPIFGIEWDFLPRDCLAIDEYYLKSILKRTHKREFIIATNHASKEQYSFAIAVCITPSQTPVEKFTLEHVVVVNSVPLPGTRPDTCPTTFRNMNIFSDYGLSLCKVPLSSESRSSSLYHSVYRASPPGEAFIEYVIIVYAIYFDDNIPFATLDKSLLSPNPKLSADLTTSLLSAFANIVSAFPSGLQHIDERNLQQQQLCAKYILSDIEALSDILLTQEERDLFTRRNKSSSLREAISKAFTPVLRINSE